MATIYRTMGLDSVEILVKVENAFGIRIPDREAEQIITVGDFHETVWLHIADRHSDKCKSQQLFYSLRRSFADRFDFPSQEFKLNNVPEEIFPAANRRQIYLSFASTENLQLPELVLTKPWSMILESFGWATILGGLLTSIVLINFFDYSKWVLLIPVIGIVLTICLSDLLNPKRTVIEEPTIREFVQKALVLNFSTFLANEGTNRREMEAVINRIIAEMAGLELEEITPEKRIGDDLGIE